MALGTLAAAVAPSLISAGLSYGASKLFGGSSGSSSAPLQNFQPTGFSGGGFSTSYGPGGLTIAPTAERSGLVRSLGKSFGDLSAELGGLKAKVAPGFSDLRRSRLAEVEASRSSAIGNLRENLARRRVLGSSFGQDALTRAENEFGQQRDKVAAESFLQELEATNQLIQQDFAARRGQFQTGLDELNLEADIATKLSGNATGVMAKNAQMLAELNAKEAANSGKFFSETFTPAFKAIGDFAGKALAA